MKKLHHIAFVVKNIEKSYNWYCEIYNAKKIDDIFIDKNQNVKVLFLDCGFFKIELLEPLNNRSPVLNFLKTKGTGSLYHLAYEVNDFNEVEKKVKEKGGIILSKSKNAWAGMEVMFVIYLNENDKQLIEYVIL